MKNQDKLFKEKLGAYTVAPADEANIRKTILAGKQLLMKNPVQEVCWYKRIDNALDNEDFTIHRMPGWGNFKRNDILVFNFPYQQNQQPHRYYRYPFGYFIYCSVTWCSWFSRSLQKFFVSDVGIGAELQIQSPANCSD